MPGRRAQGPRDRKLADAELVTVAPAGGRGRKAYAISDTGRAELLRWMTEVPPIPHRRNDMLLRVFFLGLLDAGQARDFLRARAAAAERQHEQLRQVEKELTPEGGPLTDYGRLALEWGLRFTAMQREWADWAAARLGTVEAGSRSGAGDAAHGTEA